MGIPVLEEAQKVVDWILKTVPRPLLFLLFLFLTLIIGSLIMPLFLNLTGSYCINGDKYTNSFLDVYDNVGAFLATRSLEDNVTNGTLPVDYHCLINTSSEGDDNIYFDGIFCTNCTTKQIGEFYVCEDDAYRVSDEDKSLYKRAVCVTNYAFAPIMFCEPPVDYYYDQGDNIYKCANSSKCENDTVNTRVIKELLELDFVITPVVSSEPEIVGVSCNNNKPYFSVLGIDVFDYTLWVFLMFIFLLFWIWKRIQ